MGFSGGGGGGTPVVPIAFGTAAARPAAAAGNANTAYFATDTGEATFSDGATWRPIARTSATDFRIAGANATLTISGGAPGGIATQLGSGNYFTLIGGAAGESIVDNGSARFESNRPFALTSPGTAFAVAEGANCKQGVAVLAGGSAVVANTSVTASSRIFLTVQSLAGIAAPVGVAVTARAVGVSFTITSASALDTSTVAYEIFEPA